MIRMLFIGNSFVYYNDLPQLMRDEAAKRGDDLFVDSVTKGGYFLHCYTDPEDEYGRQVMEKAKEQWDVVVLQDQSFNPAANKADTICNAKKLADMFSGAKILMYQTWAYRDGSEKLNSTGMSYDELYTKLKEAYIEAAEAVNGTVVPVGDAFKKLHDEGSKIDVYNKVDNYHPSLEGSLIIRDLFYKAIEDMLK